MTPRLCAVVCALVLCPAAAGSVRAQAPADPSAFIEWSADRPLAITDFRGKSPSRSTEASLSWVAIEASWDCDQGKASWQVRAVFDPARSSWREANQNLWKRPEDNSLMAPKDDGGRSVLAHEQLHFDLTELWARKIRALLSTLPAACKTPGGSRVFEPAIADMQHDWQDEQTRYDTETDHGMNAIRQKAWAANTARALKAR
jgi:hypothetical protein